MDAHNGSSLKACTTVASPSGNAGQTTSVRLQLNAVNKLKLSWKYPTPSAAFHIHVQSHEGNNFLNLFRMQKLHSWNQGCTWWTHCFPTPIQPWTNQFQWWDIPKTKLVNPPGPIQWQPQMLGSQTARDHKAKPTLKKQSQQPVRYKMEWSTKRWKKETESETIGKLSTSCVNFNFMCGCMYRHIIDCTNTKTQRVSFFTTSVNVCSKPCHGANCHNSQPQWGQTPSTPSSQS